MLAVAATMSAQVTFTVHGGTGYKTDEGCDKAFDNDLGTKWLAGDGDSYVDLVASENVRIMGFTYVTANDNKQYGRLPKEWEFFASNDATAMDDPLGTWNKWTMVENTLQELGCADTPAMIVFNKIDAYTWVPKEEDDLTPETKENITLDELKRTWMAKMERQGDKETGSSGHYLECLFISAREKENIDELREVLYKRVRELHVQKYPYNDFLYQDYE